MLIRMKATLIPRSAFDRYEARVRRARELYRAAGEKSADLPNFQRMAADDVAFTALKKRAMREFIASEFARLFNLRDNISASRTDIS